jgi:hypothetical protein
MLAINIRYSGIFFVLLKLCFYVAFGLAEALLLWLIKVNRKVGFFGEVFGFSFDLVGLVANCFTYS